MVGSTKVKLIKRKASSDDEKIEYEDSAIDGVMTSVTLSMKDSDGVVERESYHLIGILKGLKPNKSDKIVINGRTFIISKKQPLNTLNKGRIDWQIEADN